MMRPTKDVCVVCDLPAHAKCEFCQGNPESFSPFRNLKAMPLALPNHVQEKASGMKLINISSGEDANACLC